MSDAALAEAVADEMVAVAAEVAALMDALGGDPEIVRRHMTVLQSIDRITQVQLALADMLRPTDPVAARLARVPLDTLADRLRERIAA